MKLRMCGGVLLCVAVLVGAVACSSGGSKAPNGMTADEILANCQNAARAINTMQTYAIATEQDGNVVSDFSMSVDNSNRSLYCSGNDSMRLYALDNWIYSCNSTSKWVKTQLTEDIWNIILERLHLGELQNCTKASYIGMESVNGTNCYKMDITSGLESVINRLGLSGFTVKSYSSTIWIAENTYYPVKLSENLTWTEGDRLSVIWTYSNINQPVNIVLPAAAQNATATSDFIW